MKHICEICGYTTNRISNFKDHRNRKNPCKKKEIDGQCVIENNFNENDEKYKKNIFVSTNTAIVLWANNSKSGHSKATIKYADKVERKNSGRTPFSNKSRK